MENDIVLGETTFKDYKDNIDSKNLEGTPVIKYQIATFDMLRDYAKEKGPIVPDEYGVYRTKKKTKNENKSKFVTFCQLDKIMKEDGYKSPLMDNGSDSRALNTIRIGKDFRDKEESQFWDEFISLCGSTDGLSDLLGINKSIIIKWPKRIKDMLEKLDIHNVEDPAKKFDKKVIPTGDNGAFVASNVDPEI